MSSGVDIDAVHRRRPAFATAAATTTHTHNTTTHASMTTLAAIDATPTAAPHLDRPNNKKFAPATRSILLAISATPGISTHDISQRMPALPMATISKALANMRVAGYVINRNAGGKTQAAQWVATSWGRAKALELGPEHQAVDAPAAAASVSAMAMDDAAARRDSLKAMPHGGRSQAVNKSPERLAVEDCLALAGARGRTRAEICRMTGLDEDDVQRVLQHLVAAQRGDSVATPGTERHWRLLSAVARDEAARPKAATARVCNASTEGDYPGTELRRNPGIPAERFAAFDLPSLVNGVRVPPKRITAMCTGPAGPVGGGVSVNVRFAK